MMPARKRTAAPKRKAESKEKDTGGKKKKPNESTDTDRVSGQVLTLGQGDVGQLGLGEDIMERKKPAIVKGLEEIKVVQVECGGMHTVALSDGGKVYTWGCNDEGALGRVTKTGIEEESVVGKADLEDDVNIVQVSAGDSHTVALSDRGCVYAWGTYRDSSGQVGLQPDGNKSKPVMLLSDDSDPIIKVASGNDHTVALTTSGNIFSWGCAEQGQLGRVKECFASRGGRRGLKYILVPTQVRFRKGLKFKDVFCGSYCTFVAAKDSSDVYAWGLNNFGQLGTGDNDNAYLPVKVDSLTELNTDTSNSIRIASGQHHTVIVTSQGRVFSCGRAEYGRLGVGEDAKETATPVPVTALDGMHIKEVACGEAVSFALSSEGDVFAWGLGSCLQLGTGDEEDGFVPAKIQGKNLQSILHEAVGVSAGGQHTAFLVKDREKTNTENRD